MKILIATDGSNYSKAAVEEFCRIFAGKENLKAKVMSVYEVVIPVNLFAASAQYSQEIQDSLRKNCEDFVSQTADVIREAFGETSINISTKVLCGIPGQEIIEEAQNWNADLIVVGSHGRGFWGRLTLGSVSDSILHHASCSVLVVRSPKIIS